MGRATAFRFGPFLGGKTGENPRYISNPYSERSHQMLHEDGSARPRRGYRRFAGAPTYAGAAAVSVKMFDYVSEVVANSFTDEFLQVRRHSGSYCKLFRMDADPGPANAPVSGFPNDAIIGKADATDVIDLGSATANTYKLQLGAQTTVATIAFNALPATILTALESLSNCDPGDATVTLLDGAVHKYKVVWAGQYRGTTVPTLSITADTLTGGTGVHTATRTVVAIDYHMADSYWDMFEFGPYAYLYNAAAGDEVSSPSDAEPFLRYTKGDRASLFAVKPPADPNYTNNPITIKFRRRTGSDTLGYAQLSWKKAVGAPTWTYDGTIFTGAAAEVDTLTPQLKLIQQNTNLGLAYVRLNLNTIDIGKIDTTNNDRHAFRISYKAPDKYQFDHTTLGVVLETDNSVTQSLDVQVLPHFTSGSTTATVDYVDVVVTFPSGKDRTVWGGTHTQYVTFSFNVTKASGTPAENEIDVSPWTIGGIVDWGDVTPKEDSFHGLFQLGYSYVYSTPNLESGIASTLFVHKSDVEGQVLIQGFDPPANMGVIPYLSIPASSDVNVDKIRIYERRRVADSNGVVLQSKWRLMYEVTEASPTTLYFAKTQKDFADAAEVTRGSFRFDNMTKAKPVFGGVMYAYSDGQMRMSQIGNEMVQAADDGSNVDITDPLRAASFTLADDHGDYAIDFWSVGNVLIVLGRKGVYYMVGTTGAAMSYPRRVSGAPGCAGRHSSCRFKTPDGVTGVSYWSPDGKQVWMLTVRAVSDKESVVEPTELTRDEPGEVDRHLLQRDPDFDRNVAALNYDPISDALIASYSYRFMVYRRPGLIDRKRYWEKYTFGNQADGSWSGTGYTLFHVDQDRGIKATAPTGYIDEFEYDSTNFMAPIGGEDATPDSYSLALDTVTFLEDPEWASGQAFTVDATNGNLTSGTTRYLRVEAIGTYSIYDTLAHAQNGGGTGKLNLDMPVTTIFRCAPRDNGNPVQAGSLYWVSPTLDYQHERCLRETEISRKRPASRPSVQIWMPRNPETSASRLAVGADKIKQSIFTQGSELRMTLFIEDNSPPVYYVDVYTIIRGRADSAG